MVFGYASQQKLLTRVLKQKNKELLNKIWEFNKRGKLVYLILITFFVSFLYGVLRLIFSDVSISLNVFSIILLFFWVYRIVFYEVRTPGLPALKRSEKVRFAYILFLCFFILNAVLHFEGLFFSPALTLFAGLSIVLWIAFSILDRFILDNTQVRIYFCILLIVLLSVALTNLLYNYFISINFI